MKIPPANGNYDIEVVRSYVAQLDELMSSQPKIDPKSALMIIENLIGSLKYAVNTIEYMQEQEEMERMMKLMPVSNAKN